MAFELPSKSKHVSVPTASAASIVKTKDVLSESVKRFTVGVLPIDNRLGIHMDKVYEGGFEEGINIVYGPPGSGKTTLAVQLALRALAEGRNVKYMDLENNIRKPKILQMYNSLGYTFDKAKLSNVFFSITTWNFDELYKQWMKTLILERPDLFIIDAFSPVFTDSLFSTSVVKDKFDMYQKRAYLATQTKKVCIENHCVVVIVAHSKTKFDDKSDGETSDEYGEFGGMGRQMAHQAKVWLYVGYMKNGGHRCMVLRKHTFLKTPVSVESVPKECIIPFKITDKGIEGE